MDPDLATGDLCKMHVFDGGHHLVHQSVQIGSIRSRGDDTQRKVLPDILITNFGHGHVELVFQPVFNRPGDTPLFFQGPVPMKKKLYRTTTDFHFLNRANIKAILHQE